MTRDEIRQAIIHFVTSYSRHRQVVTTWREPIVGFVADENPLFMKFKEIIRPTHATPGELLPGARSVVVYFLPLSEKLHQENAEAGYYCSRSWALAYIETNDLIGDLNNHMRSELELSGHRVALIPPTHHFDQTTLVSDWSHRHVAYAAGVGTFGIHRLIITEQGCTGRLGSFITDFPLEASPPLEGEFCLQKSGIDCLRCVTRCRYGALDANRYSRHACYRQLLINDAYHQDLNLTDVCGKCSAMVPCSVNNPVRNNMENRSKNGMD